MRRPPFLRFSFKRKGGCKVVRPAATLLFCPVVRRGGGARRRESGRRGHRRRSERDPAATARALRGALGKALLAPSCQTTCLAWQPVRRARFKRKCARGSVATCLLRAFLAIVRAFKVLNPLSEHVSDENARGGARNAAIRERFHQKYARNGCAEGCWAHFKENNPTDERGRQLFICHDQIASRSKVTQRVTENSQRTKGLFTKRAGHTQAGSSHLFDYREEIPVTGRCISL